MVFLSFETKDEMNVNKFLTSSFDDLMSLGHDLIIGPRELISFHKSFIENS